MMVQSNDWLAACPIFFMFATQLHVTPGSYILIVNSYKQITVAEIFRIQNASVIDRLVITARKENSWFIIFVLVLVNN